MRQSETEPSAACRHSESIRGRVRRAKIDFEIRNGHAALFSLLFRRFLVSGPARPSTCYMNVACSSHVGSIIDIPSHPTSKLGSFCRMFVAS